MSGKRRARGGVGGIVHRYLKRIYAHFRLPHLLLLSFEPRNASLPFRRVRPDNYSFVIESSNMCGGIRGVRDVWPPRCRDAHAGRDYAEIIRDCPISWRAHLFIYDNISIMLNNVVGYRRAPLVRSSQLGDLYFSTRRG